MRYTSPLLLLPVSQTQLNPGAPLTIGIRDSNNKHSALCALLKELPKDNYNTLRALMLHLNRVTSLSSVNLMTSQNLGVVFGRESIVLYSGS